MDSPLERRSPGDALVKIVPPDPAPGGVNLFGVPAGESVERRFDPAKLRRVRVTGQSSEPAA
ncbi:hypothetical protein [Streptomyces lavendofoliae]|uniref:hypothetical protein n=1 Tax=Streptomyces lavendofoliae TaxID=67314 RepID=UPI003D93E3F8